MDMDVELKSDEQSVKLRKLGNEQYQKMEFFEALRYYNMSLCFAESRENISFAYANRSAVYLELKKILLCINNIEVAAAFNYPNPGKLKNRVQACIDILNARAKTITKDNCMTKTLLVTKANLFFQPRLPINPKFPCIVECLKQREDEKGCKGVYTTRDLNPGDMLGSESAVLTDLSQSERYMRCSFCFNCNYMNLSPCPTSASFMFCTQKCYDTFAMYFVNHPSESIQWLHVGGCEFLTKFLIENNIQLLDNTVFDFDFSDQNDPSYKENLLRCMFSDVNRLPNTALEFSTDNRLLSFKIPNFQHEVNEYPKFGKKSMAFVGSLYFLFVKTINHSCYNNVQNVIVNNRSVLYVTKPIKAGDQLFYNHLIKAHEWGNLYKSTQERQLYLMEQNLPKCECYYCTNDVVCSTLERDERPDAIRALIDSRGIQEEIHSKSDEEMIDQLEHNWKLITIYCKNPRSRAVEMLEYQNRCLIRHLAQMLTYPCIRRPISTTSSP